MTDRYVFIVTTPPHQSDRPYYYRRVLLSDVDWVRDVAVFFHEPKAAEYCEWKNDHFQALTKNAIASQELWDGPLL